MGALDKSTECCGANFKTNDISFVGLLTLSFPMLLLALIGIILSMFFYPFSTMLFRFCRLLIRANMNVMREYPLLPKLKCKISGALYSASPRVSGISFRFFNHFIIALCWISFCLFFLGVQLLWE